VIRADRNWQWFENKKKEEEMPLTDEEFYAIPLPEFYEAFMNMCARVESRQPPNANGLMHRQMVERMLLDGTPLEPMLHQLAAETGMEGRTLNKIVEAFHWKRRQLLAARRQNVFFNQN
jgi:hypothetical protein